jgi:hypothetical protein
MAPHEKRAAAGVYAGSPQAMELNDKIRRQGNVAFMGRNAIL